MLDLIITGSLALPKQLLTGYAALGLTELDVVLILQILRLQKEGRPLPLPEEIESFMTVDKETIRDRLAELMEQGIVQIVECDSGSGRRYCLEGLFARLTDVETREQEPVPAPTPRGQDDLHTVRRLFEKEFGRPLSPMESTQIAEWLVGSGHSPELVAEALRTAVLRGVYNFKYIDSILRDWNRHNIRTVREAAEYEEEFRLRQSRKSRSSKVKKSESKKDKYKDLYLS